ncbi:hypothetical protein CBS101457_006570 [Exobasidium rhododendri]|nr:hypothetical protein CBS101457_006570 [Exobasidium rhododendri]
MLALYLSLLVALVVRVHAAEPSEAWNDANVSEPKDFAANIFGLGCNAQVIFHRGGLKTNDQTYSYSVIGITEEGLEVEVTQERIRASTPISAVNATAGHLRGAYRLQNERQSDYSLLPIHAWGCQDGVPFARLQIKASKQNSTDWYSEFFKVKSSTPPDQVTELKAVRSDEDPGIILVSWKQSNNKYGGKIAGAYVVAGKSNIHDQLASRFVDVSKTSTALVVGHLPVNVTVVRYNNAGNLALSHTYNCPQVLV